jgi:HPt (histidine-containing phosphotransfer) domain-containing protein
VQALRGLFVAELPAQAATIARAIAAHDPVAVRAELHRLKASCGFVGSARLLSTVRALHDAPMDSACAGRFDAAVQEALTSFAEPSHAAGAD